MATDPKPVNPAEGVLGAIPSGGVSVSFTTGLPADYASPTGQLPYLQKDPKTGKITSRFYDIRNDPRVLLNNLNETERNKILKGLATKISVQRSDMRQPNPVPGGIGCMPHIFVLLPKFLVG